MANIKAVYTEGTCTEEINRLILTHYYHRDEKPFQTLSSLSEPEALKVMSRLGSQPGKVYRRFKDPQKYLQQRQATESWLREEFIRKGGQPIEPYPQYFTVGQALWIEEGYQGQSSTVKLSLSDINPAKISFTYPDSMISYWLRNYTEKKFYQAGYHGQVFLLSEILDVIEIFGMPEEAWRTDETRKHDLFIEAQYWGTV